MAKETRKSRSATNKVGLAHMVRDVLVASINKGQFPIALAGITLIIIAMRLPQKDLSTLVFRLLDGVIAGHLFGYVLFFVAIGGWYSHARRWRRTMTEELSRIGEARDEAQAAVLGNKIKSSN